MQVLEQFVFAVPLASTLRFADLQCCFTAKDANNAQSTAKK